MIQTRLTLSILLVILTVAQSDCEAKTGPRFANLKAKWGTNSTKQVDKWGIFETSFVKEHNLSNEFVEVDLNVTYTRPDGTTIKFRGFYQGKGIWRFRFMPDMPGVWHYHSDFSNGVTGPSGSFQCVPSKIPGTISNDLMNPMWFGFRSGRHVLIRALHVGDRFFASRDNTETGEPWNAQRRMAFLDWAQKQGYNTLSIAGHLLRREQKGRGQGWNSPDLWNAVAGRPNPKEFDRMEAVLNDLKDRHIMVYPFAGFFGRNSNFPRDPIQQKMYLKYTIARLAPYWNVMFMIGGPEPRLKNKPFLTVEDIHRLGSLISRLDPFDHPLSVHNPTGDDQFKDANWLTYGTLQGPKTLNRAKLGADLLRNHHSDKPLLAQETLWSGNQFHIRQTKGGYNDDDLRKNAYVITMCAAVLVFADNDGNSSSGFTGSMDLKDCRQDRHDIIKRVWDFFETVPFYRLKPRPDLIIAAEGGNAFCLAEPGCYYLFYLDAPGRLSAKLEGGPFNAKWISAQDTTNHQEIGTVNDVTNLKTPEGGNDWLLMLSKEFP